MSYNLKDVTLGVRVENYQELPLFPLNTVLFPGMVLPLHIFEERYKMMIGECVHQSRPFGIVLIKNGREMGGGAEIYEVGTTAHVTKVEKLGDGRMNIETLGYSRFRIHKTHHQKPYLTGLVDEFPLQDTGNVRAKKLSMKLAPMLQGYLNINASLGNIDLEMDMMPNDPVTLAFLTAIVLRTPTKDKQKLLDVPDLLSLLQSECRLLRREVQILKMLIENGPRWRDDPRPFSPN